MDKETLSKRKYIYCLYMSDVDELHIEKFPVIYANSLMVYIKRANRQELSQVCTATVLDAERDALTELFRRSAVYRWPVYFWGTPDYDPDKSTDLIEKKKFYRAESIKRCIAEQLSERNHCQRRLDCIDEEIDKLRSKLKKLESED